MEQHDPTEQHRQQQHVQREESRERRRAELAAAAQELHERPADDRRRAGDVRSNLGRPIRLLIPRQQIAGEPEAQHEEQQHDAEQPVGSRGVLVRAHRENADHVGEGEHHHRRRAPMVDAAQAWRRSRRSAAR